MWFFSLLVLCILHLIHCQSYDDLANDECFKKIYVCGDLRSRVSGEDGKLITNAREFVGRCKANKEFMACIDDAAIFCKGMLNDFSEMVLKNRMGLKLICSEPAWGQKYLNYAQCINENEPRLSAQCRTEDALKPDDRPWWCLIPEPCDAIERVFICTYQKIENTCGKHSGEIYRMMQVLKLKNQDVVCEFRRRNPTYCKYDRKTSTRPKRDLSKEEYGAPIDFSTTLETIQTAVSEAVQNVAKAITINVVESVVKNVESSAVKHKDEKCINKTLANFFKEISLLKDNVIADSNYQKLINIDDIHCKSTKPPFSKDASPTVSLEKFLKLACLSGKITDHCFLLAKKAWKIAKDEAQQIKEIYISEHMKDAVLRMREQLEKQNTVIDKINEQVTMYFENMGSIPIKELQCSMVSNAILKCTLDVEFNSEENEEGSGSSELNTKSEKPSYEDVLLVESLEPETEYLGDILTETTLDSAEENIDESSESSDSSLEADDRTGDIFIPDSLDLESETAVTLEPEETLELTEASDKSVSLGTTEYLNLNTDKRYILLGKPYRPTRSSNKYVLIGGPYFPRDPTDQSGAEREEAMTEVYVVSSDSLLDEKAGSFFDVSGTVSYNPLSKSLTSSTGDTVEKDKIKEREKLKVFLAEIDELSNVLRKESPGLKTSKDKIKRKENEEVTDSVASYKTQSLNGLASGYSSTFKNLDELLQSIKFEVTEEPSITDSVEAQAFNTETQFLTTSSPTESTTVHKLEL